MTFMTLNLHIEEVERPRAESLDDETITFDIVGEGDLALVTLFIPRDRRGRVFAVALRDQATEVLRLLDEGH